MYHFRGKWYTFKPRIALIGLILRFSNNSILYLKLLGLTKLWSNERVNFKWEWFELFFRLFWTNWHANLYNGKLKKAMRKKFKRQMTSFLRGSTLVWRGLTPVSRGWGPLRRLVGYCEAWSRFSARRAFKMAASPYSPRGGVLAKS